MAHVTQMNLRRYRLMKAVGFTEFGGPEVLKMLEVDDPHAGAGQVRVRVKVEAFDVTPANT